MSDINKTFIFESVYLSGGTSGTTSGCTDCNYVIGGDFDINSGELTLNTISGNTINIPLDGRYSLTGHTHTISDISDFTDNSINWNNAYGSSIVNISITGSTVKTITLEQQDGTLLQANFVDNSGSGSGDAVTGMTFNTSDGDLSLNTLSGNTITENLDGRYFIAGPPIFDCETSGTTSYVGYGVLNACKIRKIETLSGGTYTAFWSNGEETLNKIWVNRFTYLYF